MPEDDITRKEYSDYRVQRIQRMKSMMKFTIIFYGILFAFIFLYFSLWPPVKNILNAKYEIMQAQANGLKMIPNIEGKISNIEKQLAALTTENIEARLKNIEIAISKGEIKPEQLKSLQQLRDDFSVMKSFMFSNPDQLVALKTLQKEYADLHGILEKIMKKDDILREINSVRNLFYATLTIGGILVSIFAGAWFVAFRQRIKPIQEKNAQQSAAADG